MQRAADPFDVLLVVRQKTPERTLRVRSRHRAIPVRWVGRVRTALLMVGMPLILLVAAVAPRDDLLRAGALGVVLLGALLHVVADALYTWTLLRGTAMLQRDAHPAERPS